MEGRYLDGFLVFFLMVKLLLRDPRGLGTEVTDWPAQTHNALKFEMRRAEDTKLPKS